MHDTKYARRMPPHSGCQLWNSLRALCKYQWPKPSNNWGQIAVLCAVSRQSLHINISTTNEMLMCKCIIITYIYGSGNNSTTNTYLPPHLNAIRNRRLCVRLPQQQQQQHSNVNVMQIILVKNEIVPSIPGSGMGGGGMENIDAHVMWLLAVGNSCTSCECANFATGAFCISPSIKVPDNNILIATMTPHKHEHQEQLPLRKCHFMLGGRRRRQNAEYFVSANIWLLSNIMDCMWCALGTRCQAAPYHTWLGVRATSTPTPNKKRCFVYYYSNGMNDNVNIWIAPFVYVVYTEKAGQSMY